jgi:hypothetical protein
VQLFCVSGCLELSRKGFVVLLEGIMAKFEEIERFDLYLNQCCGYYSNSY